MEKTKILSVLADNNSGVLLRVAGLFSRRGYSIESIAAAQTENPAISRMTIVAHGDDDTLEQLEKQLNKLIDIIEVKAVTSETAVCREHLLIKVENKNGTRSTVLEIAGLFDANVVDTAEMSILFELTGEHRKLLSFVNLLEPYGIQQLVKTGISALERG